MENIDFGQHFKKVRKDKGLSQDNIEDNSGIKREYISKIENGKINPTFPTVRKLINKGLGLDFASFWQY